MGTKRTYVGVRFVKERFEAKISLRGTVHYLGSWPTAREAAIARDRAILHLGSETKLQEPKASRLLGPLAPRELRAIARQMNYPSASRYRGVRHQQGRWSAVICVTRKNHWVQGFDSEEAAGKAYDRMALYYRGERATRNFPERRLSPASAEMLRQERKAKRPPSASEHRGVFFREGRGKRPWHVVAWGSDRKRHFCGMWETEEEAAIAYDRAMRYFGWPSSRLNYPKKRYRERSPKELRAECVQRRKRETTSRYIGVFFYQGKWSVAVKNQDGNSMLIGRFEDEEKAARYRDKKVLEFQGPRTRLNFPPSKPSRKKRRA